MTQDIGKWKFIGETDRLKQKFWEHPNGTAITTLRRDKKWIVLINGETFKEAKSRTDAERKAKKYMRSHPNG